MNSDEVDAIELRNIKNDSGEDEASDDMDDKIAQIENQDTDDEHEEISHDQEDAGFSEKKDQDSTDEAEEDDDFSHEQNRQCDTYEEARSMD